jgi:cytochrome c-type biogenesis protein CcmI
VSALIVGTILALAALTFVLYPLFSDVRPHRVAVRAAESEPSAAQAAIAALREVEFDRETGKLSDSDYAKLKADYTREALAAMRAQDATSAAVGDDEVEAAILKYRTRVLACPTCGPRPEPDAAFCSSCGRYLAGQCGACGAPVTETGARYCGSCGKVLAA